MRRASALALVLRQLRPCQDTSSAAHRLQQHSAPWLLGGNGFALPAGAAAVGRLGRRLVSQQPTSFSSAPARAAAASIPAFWHSISPSFAHMLSANKKRLACKLHEFETTLAALVCSLTDTRSGQRLLAGILPFAAMVLLFPSKFKARAWEVPLRQPQPSIVAKNKQQWSSRLQLPKPVASMLEELLVCVRGLYLAMLFSPALALAPLVFWLGLGAQQGREMWMDLLLWTIERAGPAFIKWAQWSSSRPDLFPPDLCSRFERLQSSAPSHPGQLSVEVVQAAFEHLERQPLFESFELQPVASGSIAQVHRARLSPYGAAVTGSRPGQVVAVKVRHPGVTHIMQRDFVLMQRAAKLCGLLPGLSDLRLDESIRQFGGPLKEQLDLTIEARHLDRFNHNFRLWQHVSFPRPLHPLVAPDVLVETFEEGDLISAFVNIKEEEPSKQRCLLAETGLNIYLQMLLKDNFCHADLHPGNILVRAVDNQKLHGFSRLLSNLLHVEFHPRLVLLDAGMIAELNPIDQRNLVDFFRALTRQDGENIARSVLTLSEMHTCKDPEAFVSAMSSMFAKLDPAHIRKHTNVVFQDMIETLRQHQVTLKSTVSTIVVTALVLEGWSSKLDPDLHILDSMRDILGNDWSERISRTVDRIMASGSVILA